MKDVLDSTVKSESAKFSDSYIFVKALVPINSVRWAPFDLGSSISTQRPMLINKVTMTFDNLLIFKEYVKNSQSEI